VSRGFQALFVASILVASTAMFALAESRKLDPAPIKQLVVSAGPKAPGKPRPAIFSPGCNCPTSYARISFRLETPGALRAWIVSPAGAIVRELVDKPHVSTITLVWHGNDAHGAEAPDGDYRLRMRTAGETRTLPFFVVVRTTPLTFRASVAPKRLTPNGDGVDDHAVITWHAPVQLFDVHLEARNGDAFQRLPVYRHARSASFQWPRATCSAGTCRVTKRPAAGSWTLVLTAEDVAGNDAAYPVGTVKVVANR
jgi:hypothetical protein